MSYLSHMYVTGVYRELKPSADLKEKALWTEPLMTNSVPMLMTVAMSETDDSGLSYIRIFPH